MILLLRREATPRSSVVVSGLKALFEFSDGSGQILRDVSGGGHDGTLGSTIGSDTNDPNWTSSGLAFATDDFVDCGASNELQPDAWTVCAAVKMTPATVNPLLGWGAAAQYPAIFAAAPFNGNRPIVWLNNTCFRYFEQNDAVDLQDGGWHFLAFCCPGNAAADIAAATLTVDGQEQAVNSTTNNVDGAVKTTCRLAAAGTAYFGTSEMAFLSLHNRVLSAQEKETMRAHARLSLAGRVELP